MRFPLLAAAFFSMVMTATPAVAQIVDYLGIPGPVELGGKSYKLAWNSQPSENYTKQEYVPEGQSPENYGQMVLVERVTGDIKVIDTVRSQMDMLEKRKGIDPLVSYEVLQKDATKEVVLDFLVSVKNSKGGYVVEWNLYRYVPMRSGVLVFAVSHRAYGNDNAKAFLSDLKQLRTAQTGVLLKADLPKPAY
ncbi:hypothetical protein [Pseudaminobacter salicylatoxidans]|uniref:hypothetical protein n=1 Tax=Pseudaminobacter salicylatoxidans TaxID=93369 RepID=UPI00031F2D36|nr:hypothetical protein [Pseudaminobacter salicylatoxidans]